jgi:GGDEF domain-containing protein
MMDLDEQRSPATAACSTRRCASPRWGGSSAKSAARAALVASAATTSSRSCTARDHARLLLAERIRARVADTPSSATARRPIHDQHRNRGAARVPTLDHLLQAADEALYRAKTAGCNQVSR